MTLSSSRIRFLAAFLLCTLCVVDGFNVDVKNCMRYQGPRGSMFGFSVAEHKERGRSWLLIGAPEAQTNQPGVQNGGAVYKCNIAEETDCKQIPFDTTGPNRLSNSKIIDQKSNQWFGATVSSSGENGVVLACAPRYVYYSSSGARKDPVGTCYTTKDFNKFNEYSPCRTRNWGQHKQGSCQAGLGASVSKDGQRLFIGAVGSWFWQGQIYVQNVYSRPDVIFSNEGPPTDDDSYLGYSVATGNFGFNSESGTAVGVPRGAGLLGKVVLYNTNLTNLYNITGDQMGSYFGYSICVSDVDGDGGDDIIVGAPLYSEYMKNDGSYETGRVYVYLKREGYRFYERNTRMGINSKSRFGLALTTLGDINRDGYGDFAVGAPYDGLNELGAVYIYHGTRNGVREKYSQVIKSEDVYYGRTVSTFGFSLAGGMDLDNNEYPDLIIGAYESDTVFYMKSRPVVQMSNTIEFQSPSKQISLEDRGCLTKDGSSVPCLYLKSCLKYTGLGVDEQLNIEYQIILDSKKSKAPRMFVNGEESIFMYNRSLTLNKNTIECPKVLVFLKNNIRDKLTPLEAELRYRIIEDTRKFTTTLPPVLDLENELYAVSRDSIMIQKNCGDDNICIPDLRLIAKSNVETFLLGSTEKIKIDVIVQNEGEDSFETTYHMTIPQGINYVKVERMSDNDNDIPVQCSAPSVSTNHTLLCDIGNPLPRSRYVQFRVILEPYQTAEGKARYDFFIAVNSTNPENSISMSDNAIHLGVPLWVETDLIIEGTSKPEDVHYNTTSEDVIDIKEEKQIGPQVVHLYGIRNKGPSDILEAEAYIDWPLYTLNGEPLLYLLEMPETIGPVKCQAMEPINPLKISVDRMRKSYFESSGLISSGAPGTTTYTGQSSSSSSSTVFGSSSNSISSSDSIIVKSFSELTEEERKRLVELQKKDEEAAEAENGEGSYVQNTRFHNLESQGGVTHVEGQKISGSSTVNVNRGSSFNAGSPTLDFGRNSHESSGASVNTQTLQQSGFSSQPGASQSSSSEVSRFSSSGKVNGNSQVYGAYGEAHFDESSGSLASGSSSSRFESGTQLHGSLGGYNQGLTDSKTWETSRSSLNSANIGSNRASANQNSYNKEVSAGKNWEASSSASQGNWNEGSRWGVGGRNNYSSFQETEKSHIINTTWDSASLPSRTYIKDQWRTNNDGHIRNGSLVRVENGVLDYNDALRKINNGNSFSNVVTSIPGDDSDLSLTLSGVNEHQNSGFKQSKIDESETVQRYRTVDGKLYKVNNVDDWHSLTSKDTSTQVYEAQNYYPQNYRKPTNNNGQDVEGKFKLYTKFKRNVEKAKKCGPTKCVTVKCTIGPLSKDQEVWLSFRSRAWISTLKKVAPNRQVKLSSKISSQVTKLPYIGKPDNKLAQVRSHEVFTNVIPIDLGGKPEIIPLWIVVLAAVVGTAILLLLVFLLYKCGFFKRNRPSNAPEKQPLTHRNGQSELYQTGDEAL
ncbi:integrin alpha-PS2 isoform X2 [Daktulosphaira vitifoliae]|uniref:integrin alpha-PS2 isoform X2 n=1 Tax=Daktulosphaira vitifoliae TaxID=58002 RepID=UPI0021AA1E16|nr:integrin alpha-PS2 isoform X2 [Daktulosphaira vitifoliae]